MSEFIRSCAAKGLIAGAFVGGIALGIAGPQGAEMVWKPTISAAQACQAYEQTHPQDTNRLLPISSIPQEVIANCGLKQYITSPSTNPDLGIQTDYSAILISLPNPEALQNHIKSLKENADTTVIDAVLGAILGGGLGAFFGSQLDWRGKKNPLA